ncbi:MAG: beta-galactosidase, partial [Bacteroidales bacterium]|nr:beta-galactosidase [Candidatus Equibacterium intestinale]
MMALFNRILAAVMVMFLSAACSKNNEDDKPVSDPWDSMSDITVSKIAVYDGKPCLEVDGKPFAVYGAQIRVDIFRSVDKMDWSGIEKYFAAAKELGLNCVQVPCPWAFLEPKEDQYDYETIDKILEFAVKYGVKGELLWFSTNFIGDSYSWLVPTY